MSHSNPYVQTLLEKGYTERELRKPVARPEVPANMKHLYATYAEYEAAIHEMLNGL
jgi:hypothetical protein